MERDPDAIVQLKLRLPEKLRADLAKAAEENGKSLNKEIVERLMRSRHLYHLFGETGRPPMSEFSRFKSLVTSAQYDIAELADLLRELARAMRQDSGPTDDNSTL